MIREIPRRDSGIGLMRDAALLAAACHLAEPHDQVPSTEAGWRAQPEARAELDGRLEKHELSDDPIRRRLMDGLGLSAPAYWLVMLSAAVELHPEVAAAVSLLTEDERQLLPTPTVLARMLHGIRGTPYDVALAAALGGGQARAAGLVEVPEQATMAPLSHQPVRIAADELSALLVPEPTADSGDAVGWLGLGGVLVAPGPHAAFGAAVVRPAQRLLEWRGLLVVRGQRRGSRQLACDLAGQQGRAAALVTVLSEPDRPPQLPGVAALARARAHTGDPLVVVDLHALTSVHPPMLSTLRRAARSLGDVVVLVDENADTGELAVVDAPVIDYPAAWRVWSCVVDEVAAGGLALQLRVGVEEALSAVREVSALQHPDAVDDDERTLDVEALAERVRAQGARRMGRYVTVVASDARLAKLVVPEPLGRQLDEIISWHRSSHRVRWDMELGAGDPVGTGLTCLFSGKSGTGKTFAARCLANELGLNLYRIDLSQVVSKFIGDTEKALAQIFDEVEAGHGLLLFDEADALFGRRSEVKDAHDRYANIEVGYLLQRLETYDGVAVLTTNLQGNMDSAFVRRLRFILQFPAPDRSLRRRLWEQSLPPERWRDGDLHLDLLADRFQLSGGAIHNIGLAAAHLAAATPSGRITLGHITRATQRELHKAGRPTDDAVFDQLSGDAS
jgi:hypothetical protein